jgi:uncharacterized membrane protein
MSKTIYKSSDPGENAYVTLKNIVSLLCARVTSSTLDSVKTHPKYPSMLSLSESLNEWNIETMGVKISKEQLSETPLPSIAYLEPEGIFVALTEHNDDNVKYLDSSRGEITESIEEFTKKWRGIMLLVQANEESGERNYKQKRGLESFKKIKNILLVPSNILLWVTSVVLFLKSPSFLPWVALLLLKVVGLGICIGLIHKQYGKSNALVSKICKGGENFDCTGILNSPFSKVLGVSMSELGMLYFAGGALSLLLMSIAKAPAFDFLLIFNVITLPYTAFSVYYQWRIVKAWCPFCLVVMILFWLEFFILFQVTGFDLVMDEILIVFMGFAIPLIIWFLFRDVFIKAQHVEGLERSLLKFKYSSNIFNALLERQPLVEIEEFSQEIMLGNESASTSITIVSNPLCGPCSSAHQELGDLLKHYPDQLKVKIRFSVNPAKNGSVDNTVAKEIIRKAISGNKDGVREALHYWFDGQKKDVKKWLERIGSSENASEEEKVDEVFKKHYEWCSATEIHVTPTFFINNKKLPEEYNVTDLKYHIRHLIASS